MMKCRGAELLQPLGSHKCPSRALGEGKAWSRVCDAHSRVNIPRYRVIKLNCPALCDSEFDIGSAIAAKVEELPCVRQASVMIDAEIFAQRSDCVMTNEVLVVVDDASNTAAVKTELERSGIEGLSDVSLSTDDVAFMKCNVHKSMCPERNFSQVKDGSCAVGRWKQHVYYKSASVSATPVGRKRKRARTTSATSAVLAAGAKGGGQAVTEVYIMPSGVATARPHVSASSRPGIHYGHAVVDWQPGHAVLASTVSNLQSLAMRLQAWLLHPVMGLSYSLLATRSSAVTHLIARHTSLASLTMEDGWVTQLCIMVTGMLSLSYQFSAPSLEAANAEYSQFSVFVAAGMECQVAITQIMHVLTFMGQLLQLRKAGLVDPLTWLAVSIPEVMAPSTDLMHGGSHLASHLHDWRGSITASEGSAESNMPAWPGEISLGERR